MSDIVSKAGLDPFGSTTIAQLACPFDKEPVHTSGGLPLELCKMILENLDHKDLHSAACVSMTWCIVVKNSASCSDQPVRVFLDSLYTDGHLTLESLRVVNAAPVGSPFALTHKSDYLTKRSALIECLAANPADAPLPTDRVLAPPEELKNISKLTLSRKWLMNPEGAFRDAKAKGIAKGYLMIGEINEALKVAAEIEDREIKLNFVNHLVEKIAESGKGAMLDQIVKGSTDPLILSIASGWLIRSGYVNEGLAIARRITDEGAVYAICETLLEVSSALMEENARLAIAGVRGFIPSITEENDFAVSCDTAEAKLNGVGILDDLYF